MTHYSLSHGTAKITMSMYQNAAKIVILGGTFDPIHNGHIQLADKLYEVFNTPITFMPTGIPPHKAPPLATDRQRLEMLELAIATNSTKFQIERMEIEANDFGYTYRTMEQLRQKVGWEIPIYFLIGGDSLLTLDTWHHWETIIDKVNFVVAWREGYSLAQMTSQALIDIFNKNRSDDLSYLNSTNGKFYELNFTPQNVSSTMIRKRVHDGLDISDLVPQAVADYIIQHKIYK